MNLKKAFLDPLRFEIDSLILKLTISSIFQISQLTDEETLRFAITDKDLEGRDLITIISQNSLVDLFAHPYIRKLGLEAWQSPYFTNTDILLNNSSAILVREALEERKTPEVPLKKKA